MTWKSFIEKKAGKSDVAMKSSIYYIPDGKLVTKALQFFLNNYGNLFKFGTWKIEIIKIDIFGKAVVIVHYS